MAKLRSIVSRFFRRRPSEPKEEDPDALIRAPQRVMAHYRDFAFIDDNKIPKINLIDADIERRIAAARADDNKQLLQELVVLYISLSRFAPNVTSTRRLFIDFFAGRLPRGSDRATTYNRADAQRQEIEQYATRQYELRKRRVEKLGLATYLGAMPPAHLEKKYPDHSPELIRSQWIFKE